MFKKLLTGTVICIGTGAYADGEWTVGILGVGTTGTYVGEDDTVGVAPFLTYETDRLSVGLDGVSYNVLEYQQGTVGLALGYRGGPDFPNKDPLFDGLKRDDAVEAGITAQLDFGNAYVSLHTMTDVSDTHGGTEANVVVGYAIAPGSFVVSAEVGARFRDKDLNQYLYGVSATEATAARSAYAADQTTTAFANLAVVYPVTQTISAVGIVEYEDLGSNADSPLVDKSDVVGVGLGLIMSF
ncbi:MipA/OmpV family protein [Yoonia sp. SS1-5]|uniref:MipA/OmpV family protein n=1 Tax=Yoonia rhodophyticola TaxID=3137370 RepID=A0AAN0NIT6_9RHOB